jgi:hypothetical protein
VDYQLNKALSTGDPHLQFTGSEAACPKITSSGEATIESLNLQKDSTFKPTDDVNVIGNVKSIYLILKQKPFIYKIRNSNLSYLQPTGHSTSAAFYP